MFKGLWLLACKITLVIGVLLTFMVVLELLRGFVFFYRFSPTAGWVYAGTVVCMLLFSTWYIGQNWIRLPRVLTAPDFPDDPAHASFDQLRGYCRYLKQYMSRLSSNELLDEADRTLLHAATLSINDAFGAHPLRDDLVREVEAAEENAIKPVLGKLHIKAEEEVRHCVRDIMLGVTLSPYHSIDIMIVLYRNTRMVLRIATIFANRPNKREQLLIMRDTLRIVAAVNILNMGRTLVESLFSNLPIVGRAVDDISQGLGAGLLTSATGHAAILRCAAFRPWNRDKAVRSIAGEARGFLVDVRNMFTRDVLPQLKPRLSVGQTEDTNQPSFWNTLNQGITTAVDNSINTLDALIVKPAVVGTKSAARVGSQAARLTANTGTKTYNGTGRVLRTFGQRIRYTFFRNDLN